MCMDACVYVERDARMQYVYVNEIALVGSTLKVGMLPLWSYTNMANTAESPLFRKDSSQSIKCVYDAWHVRSRCVHA